MSKFYTESEFDALYIDEDMDFDEEYDLKRDYALSIIEGLKPKDLEELEHFESTFEFWEYVEDEVQDIYSEIVSELSQGEGLYEEGANDQCEMLDEVFPSKSTFYYEDLNTGCFILFSSNQEMRDLHSVHYCIVDWNKYAYMPKPYVRSALRKHVKLFTNYSTEELNEFKKKIEHKENLEFFLSKKDQVNASFSPSEFPVQEV